MLPKQLDPAFLYGEKRLLKRLKQRHDDIMALQGNMSIEESLINKEINRETIDRVSINESMSKDFLKRAYSSNPQFSKFNYLPLIQITLDPPSSQGFDSQDIEQLLINFGEVLKIINKEKVIFALMGSIPECWMIVKILNGAEFVSNQQTHKLVIKVCFEDPTDNIIFKFNHKKYKEQDFIVQDDPKVLRDLNKKFKYISIFEIDVDQYQKQFKIKERILGLKGSNLCRIQYLVEKQFAYQNISKKEFGQSDIQLSVVANQDSSNKLMIMTNHYDKFIVAQKYVNELFAQIKEEFKFFQDYQLHSLLESRVKRTDMIYQPLEIQFQIDKS
ncbi:hypothetical protein pb186bvf_006206 [Paramecium bursaria]